MCYSSEKSFKLLGRRLNGTHGFFPKRKYGIATSVIKCKNCGLIFSNPQPIPHNMQDHYNVDPIQYWPEEYFNIDEKYFEYEIAKVKELKGELKGLKFLDIGAGIGKSMIVLEKEGMEVYGLEGSESFYKMAIEKMGVSADQLQLKTLEDAEYQDDYFDFISFGAVLEHLYDPNKSLVRALKWLKRGGLIHVEVPNSKYLVTRILNLNQKLLLSNYVNHLSPMHSPFHLYEFSIESFKENGNNNNYEIADYKIEVCTTPFPKPLPLVLDPIMKYTKTGMQLMLWITKK